MKHWLFSLPLWVATGIALASEVRVTPHWINSGLDNRDLTLSPDGRELYSTIMAPGNRFAVIVTSRRFEGEWQPVEIAPFSGTHADIEPMFSPDGNRLYFASKRPKPDRDSDDWDIWYVERTARGTWSDPVNPGPPVNSASNEFYPSAAASGNLYFTAEREVGEGSEDILRAVIEDGNFARVESLGPGVNTEEFEFNAYVAGDESFVVFSAQGGRQKDIGGGDLYISRRGADGAFGEAKLLPREINSTALDYCPFVHDGRLFFTSRRQSERAPFTSFQEFEAIMTSPRNGLGDIYSVPMEAIAP